MILSWKCSIAHNICLTAKPSDMNPADAVAVWPTNRNRNRVGESWNFKERWCGMQSIMGNMLQSHANSQDNFPTAASILNIPFKILFLKWLAGAGAWVSLSMHKYRVCRVMTTTDWSLLWGNWIYLCLSSVKLCNNLQRSTCTVN